MLWPLATRGHWALCMWLVLTEMCNVSKNNTEFWSLDTKKAQYLVNSFYIDYVEITIVFYILGYVKCTIKYIYVSFYFFNVAAFFFFLMWIAFVAYIIFQWDRLVWKSGPSTQGFTCFEMKTHFWWPSRRQKYSLNWHGHGGNLPPKEWLPPLLLCRGFQKWAT